MSPEQRTLLVPIDAHGVDRNTLETLVQVAGKLRRALLGLVLDNPRLQKIAALPFATEIILTEGRERRLQGVGRETRPPAAYCNCWSSSPNTTRYQFLLSTLSASGCTQR